jgi:excisionase family DNA binding protein
MERLLRSGVAAKRLGVSRMTVWRWIKGGKLRAVKIGREYRVPESEIERFLGLRPEVERAAIYARVSSSDQRADLDRQVEYLKEYCASRGYQVVEILRDIGSGLNERRRGLRRLFKLGRDKAAEVVVITYRDRLTRFGYSYLEEFFESHGLRVEAIFGEKPKDMNQELVEDLIAIVASFAGRLYGMRSRKRRRVVEAVERAVRDP